MKKILNSVIGLIIIAATLLGCYKLFTSTTRVDLLIGGSMFVLMFLIVGVAFWKNEQLEIVRWLDNRK